MITSFVVLYLLGMAACTIWGAFSGNSTPEVKEVCKSLLIWPRQVYRMLKNKP